MYRMLRTLLYVAVSWRKYVDLSYVSVDFVGVEFILFFLSVMDCRVITKAWIVVLLQARVAYRHQTSYFEVSYEGCVPGV